MSYLNDYYFSWNKNKKKNMGAGESKLDNKIAEDEVLVVDNKESDDEEVTHYLHREIEELRVENRNLKKEVEEINVEKVRLRREQNERADKYSKLKKEMQQRSMPLNWISNNLWSEWCRAY